MHKKSLIWVLWMYEEKLKTKREYLQHTVKAPRSLTEFATKPIITKIKLHECFLINPLVREFRVTKMNQNQIKKKTEKTTL